MSLEELDEIRCQQVVGGWGGEAGQGNSPGLAGWNKGGILGSELPGGLVI